MSVNTEEMSDSYSEQLVAFQKTRHSSSLSVILERRDLISRPLCENRRPTPKGAELAGEHKIRSNNDDSMENCGLRMTSKRVAVSVESVGELMESMQDTSTAVRI